MSSTPYVAPVNSESTLEEYFSAEWHVNNFSYMTMPLCTPIFSPIKEIDSKFVFQIWYKTIDLKEMGQVSALYVTLRMLPGPPVPELLMLESLNVSVHYSNGKIYDKYRIPNSLYVSNLTSLICIDASTHFSELISPHATSLSSPKPLHGSLIQSKALILRCRMKFSNHLPKTAEYHDTKKAFLNLTSFVEDLKELYESSAFSDISIQIGDKTLKSHRSVLASHSPVFRRMLETDFKESKTGVIELSDASYEVFENFLRYLYCAVVEDKSFTNVQQLYSLSDLYDVKTLKRRCAEIISESCLENSRICEVLGMAYHYDDDILKKAAKSYAADHIQNILPTTEWENLVAQNPVIGYEVLLQVNMPKETVIYDI